MRLQQRDGSVESSVGQTFEFHQCANDERDQRLLKQRCWSFSETFQ